MMDMDGDELSCAICLKLLQDPRCLPCLHTFCRECLQRSLPKDQPIKCSVCRAKHELSENEIELLPVNGYAVQQLPLKKLHSQLEVDHTGQQSKCSLCGELVPLVAWCDDCETLICQACVAMHKKIVNWRGHQVVAKDDKLRLKTSLEKRVITASCLRHSGQDLKYLCLRCSETVCSDCLLMGPHKDHQYTTVEEARHDMETKMRGLMDSVVTKKEEFNEFLDKVAKIEGEAQESSELLMKKVNNVFDGIVASVEAQREEALQSVSQGVKEIWSQKELAEIGLAQLNSYIRFAVHTHKCTTDSSYVTMATQGIKLMERLKDTHADEQVLDHRRASIGPQRKLLGGTLKVGQPSLKFTPDSSAVCIPSLVIESLTITVSLTVDDLPVMSTALDEAANCDLVVDAKLSITGDGNYSYVYELPVEVNLLEDCPSWKVVIATNASGRRSHIYGINKEELFVQCKLTGDIETEPKQARYTYQ